MTNKEQLVYFRNELDRIGREIESRGLEPELKNRARVLARSQTEEFIPEVFDVDPLRDEKLCDFYIYLFAQFEALKRVERRAIKSGSDAHAKWLGQSSCQISGYRATVLSFARNVAEKIAVSGVTAGIIWLGKMVIDNWPHGYQLVDEEVED